jgi:hypothetical protein
MLQQYQLSPAFWGKRFEDPVKLFKELDHVKNAGFQPASVRATETQLLADSNLTILVSRNAD